MYSGNRYFQGIRLTDQKQENLSKTAFKEVFHYFVLFVLDSLSGKRDSNSRPQPWQGCALPTELFPQNVLNSATYVTIRLRVQR